MAPRATLSTELIAGLIAEGPDFPHPGITFSDITPLLASAEGLPRPWSGSRRPRRRASTPSWPSRRAASSSADRSPSSWASGSCPSASRTSCRASTSASRTPSKYGTETLALHSDALRPGQRVLVVDDVLATGGTVAAAAGLVRRLGAEVAAVAVVLDLGFLDGRRRLRAAGLDQVHTLVTTQAA